MVSYRKQENEARLDLSKLGEELAPLLHNWTSAYGKEITLKSNQEDISAEAGVLLGTVHAVKATVEINISARI